ncbi:hypothetical protein WJX72_003295 [[Myrmecia] bisecta]|uniref:Uncharacterized protein n=1 Tax=[Myrmecia] bisecta TaxID=41462 RepID=A0AAW1PBK5_9CHLO
MMEKTVSGVSTSSLPATSGGTSSNSTSNPQLTKPSEVTKEMDISNNPDFVSLLPVGNRLFSFVHFESPRPGAIDMMELKQDANGTLSVIGIKHVDWSLWGGLWTPCAGSVTPWNTHLGSEEYEPDAKAIADATSLADATPPANATSLFVLTGGGFPSIINFMRYYGLYANNITLEDVKTRFNPYLYGYATELTANADGSYQNVKWYTLGRGSKELPYVMPDNRTVYITDDGTNTAFFRFVADRAGDLSSGTLYGAKAFQLSAANGGAFNLQWIKLGSANQTYLAKAVQANPKFYDLFNATKPQNGTCPPGYKSINAGQNDGNHECLVLKPGKEVEAAFLETRRYLAYLNGTTEFSKWEGLTYDPIRRQIYTSMSDVRYGMEDFKQLGKSATKYDIGGPNDIRLDYNPCGCVYTLNVDANYTATNMTALICGDTKYGTNANNTCNVNEIANPDNVAFLTGHDQLIIGEDTDAHENDVFWVYDMKTGEKTRIFATPYGAETTSAYWYPNINGHAYILAVTQHPYGEGGINATKMVDYPGSTGLAAHIGYFGPLEPSALTATGSASNNTLPEIQFEQLPVPYTDALKHKVQGSMTAVIGGCEVVNYQAIMRTGDKFGGSVFGRLLNAKGQPVRALDSNLLPTNEEQVEPTPDFVSYLPTCGSLYSIAHIEASPGAYYLTQLSQSANGTLTVTSQSPIDFSAYGGVLGPCAGSVSPWNTHLGSEETTINARAFAEAKDLADLKKLDSGAYSTAINAARYFDLYLPNITLASLKATVNPYNYGYITEVTVNGQGCTKAVKHYAMGRMTSEMSLVMPDQKTVYISDDGDNRSFYKFVADTAGDLSSGTLYAVKVNQTSAVKGGSFNLNWIKLGNASDALLRTQVANLTFDKIFEVAVPVGSSCPAGFRSINSAYGQECLKVKAGFEVHAAFFETGRYAAYVGATTEFTKFEGTTYDAENRAIYASVSYIRNAMLDNSSKYDVGGPNDIRVPANPCGCVYKISLSTTYDATSMSGLLCGSSSYNTDATNKCDRDIMANPDNLNMLTGQGQLAIAEDTDNHENAYLWIYDLKTAVLTRVLSTPYGAEVTGTYFYPNLGGFSYIMSQVQHPYEGAEMAKLSDKDATGAAGWVGYLGPMSSKYPKPDAKCYTEDFCQAAAPSTQPAAISAAG